MLVNGSHSAPTSLAAIAKHPHWIVEARGRRNVVLAKKGGKAFVCFAEDRPIATPFGDYGAGAGEWI